MQEVFILHYLELNLILHAKVYEKYYFRVKESR